MQSRALELDYLLDCYQFQIDLRYELAIFLKADGFMELLNLIQVLREIVGLKEGKNKGE